MSRNSTARKEKGDTILVTAHDAGGAEYVSAYVKKYSRTNSCICYISGPAVAVFKKKGIPYHYVREDCNPDRIFENHPEVSHLLTAIDWSSDFGLRFLGRAKSRSVKTSVFLDHWINYRERFGYPRKEWRRNLPDTVIVGDHEAFRLAKNVMPSGIVIREIRNPFFEDIRVAYALAQKQKGRARMLLFVSEPITAAVNSFGDMPHLDFSEYSVVKDICDVLMSLPSPISLCIRLHPAERSTKFRALLAPYRKKLNITLSKKAPLVQDLAQAIAVIGMDTAALYIAGICGIPVVSYLPDAGHKGTIPSSSLKRIRTKDQLLYFVRHLRITHS